MRKPHSNFARPSRSDSGVALVICMLVLVALTFGAIGLMTKAQRGMRGVANHVDNQQCLFTADLGAQSGRGKIVNSMNTSYQSGGFYPTTSQSVTSSTVNGQSYAVTAKGNDTAGLSNIFGQTVQLQSDCGGRNGTQSKVVLAGKAGSGSVWETGLCACSDLDATSMFHSDSYNSSAGTYASQTPGTQGNIGSNGNLDTGSNYIHGSAMAGNNITGTASVTGGTGAGGSSTYSGAGNQSHMNPAPTPCPCTQYDVTGKTAAAALSNNNASSGTCASKITGTAFNMTGNNSCTFPAGTYYFSSFNVGGSAQVSISGAVTMYFHGAGPFDVGGSGILNTSDHARDLKIYSDTTSDITIHGGSQFSAYVYAPMARLRINGNFDVYGGAVADEVDMIGTPGFHWDARSNIEQSYVKNFNVQAWYVN